MHRQIITFLLVITLLIQPAGYSFSEVHAAENSGSSYGTPSEDGGGPASDNGEDNGVSIGSGQESGEGTDGTDGESGPENAKDSPEDAGEGGPAGGTQVPAEGETGMTAVPSEEEEEETEVSSEAADDEEGIPSGEEDGDRTEEAALSESENGTENRASETAKSGNAATGATGSAASGAKDLKISMIDSEISYDDVSSTWGGDLMGLTKACERAAQSSFGGRTVTVAVIDTGVNTSHELLQGRITGGKSFVPGSDYDSDENGHGTHIAGIIAANTPPNVRIMPLKVLGADKRGTVQAVHDAVLYAASNGADIINLSLGVSKNSFRETDGSFSADDYGLYEATLGRAVSEARGSGCVVIASAGNESSDVYEAGALPACCEGCITVSALSCGGGLYHKSNYGSVDFCAPGEAVYSAFSSGNSSYEKLSGTSMSVPFISSAYAFLMLYNPGESAGALTDLLAGCCDDSGGGTLYGLPVFTDGVVPCDRPECPVIRTVVCREDSITLKWTDQDGISFDIYRKSEEDHGFLKAGSSASGVFTDNSVAFNRSYTYYIEAEEPGHYSGSDRSGEVTARAYVAVTGISCRAYDPYDLVLSPGKSLYLHAAPVPTDASFPKMLWSSEDPGIASVSAEGKVTAVSPGTTKILIRSEDESYQGSESYEVNVVPPEKCGDDLYWYFDSDSKALVIFGEGDMYDFTGNSFPWFSKRFNIEKIVFSESVTGIGSNAFPGITVKSIEGTDHILRIGSGAFRSFYCYDTFALAEGVRIDPNAFKGAKLQNIVIPSDLTVDGSFFSGNYFGGFETAEDCETYSVRDGALMSADGSRLIRFPYSFSGSFRIPETVEEIAPSAFKACTLTGVEVPAGITDIPDSAFESCQSLKTCSLPDTVTSIGSKAFYCCSFLRSSVINPGLTYIGPRAFYRVEFDSVTVPPSLTEIGAYALAGMEAAELRISEGVTSLGEGAMQNSNCSLIHLYLPASVEKIGKDCFYYTFSRSQIHYNGFTKSFNAIAGSSGQDYAGSKLIIDTGGTTGGLTWSAYGESGHVTLTISGSGAMPDYRTEKDCPWSAGRPEIERVVIEEGVTYLGKNSLCQMPSLKTIELPSSVTDSPDSYGYGLFLGDTGLERFVTRDGLRTVFMGYLYGQYSGRPYKPPVIVRDDNGKELNPEKDYTVTYQKTVSAGQGSVLLRFGREEGYTSSVYLPFLVITDKLDGTDIKSLSSITLSPDSFNYDGSAHFPNVRVKSGIYTLHEGSDYRLSYPEHCVETGRYTVTATGIGVYVGTRSASFVITPAASEEKPVNPGSGDETQDGQNTDGGKKTDGGNDGSDPSGSPPSTGGSSSRGDTGSNTGNTPRNTGSDSEEVSGSRPAGGQDPADTQDRGAQNGDNRGGSSGRGGTQESNAGVGNTQNNNTLGASTGHEGASDEGGRGSSGHSANGGDTDFRNTETQKEPSPEEGKAPADGQEETSVFSSRAILLLLLLFVILYLVIRIFRAGLHRE